MQPSEMSFPSSSFIKTITSVMFYLSYKLILFFTVVTIIDGAHHVVEEDDEIPKHCGQYGFRCLDKETVEFCDEKDLDGKVEVPQTFFCSVNLTCNEDSSSYCSPDSRFIKRGVLKHQENIDLMGLDENGDVAGFIIHDVESLDLSNGLYDDDVIDTTTFAGITEDEDSGKCNSEEEPSFKEEAINCMYYGFYPDPEDTNLFYFCDLKKNGKGFNIRHMNCEKGRVFDKIFRECILIGTTRQVRNDKETTEDGHMVIYHDEGGFNCTGKKPGKYEDTNNCHIYYLCLPAELYSPFTKLTVKCPKRSAYDPVQHVCNKRAISRCASKNNNEDQINCRKQMRFRETRSCDHYFLCYQDQVIKLHCPDYQQFDDKELQCLPQHLVECN